MDFASAGVAVCGIFLSMGKCRPFADCESGRGIIKIFLGARLRPLGTFRKFLHKV